MLIDLSSGPGASGDPEDGEVKAYVVNAAGGGGYLTGGWIFSRPTSYRGVMYRPGQNFPAIPKKAEMIVYHLIRPGQEPRLTPDVLPLESPVKVLRFIRTVRRGMDGETIQNAQIIDFGALSSESMAIQVQYLRELAARAPQTPGTLFEKTQFVEVVME